jgi:hypothetical protein
VFAVTFARVGWQISLADVIQAHSHLWLVSTEQDSNCVTLSQENISVLCTLDWLESDGLTGHSSDLRVYIVRSQACTVLRAPLTALGPYVATTGALVIISITHVCSDE